MKICVHHQTNEKFVNCKIVHNLKWQHEHFNKQYTYVEKVDYTVCTVHYVSKNNRYFYGLLRQCYTITVYKNVFPQTQFFSGLGNFPVPVARRRTNFYPVRSEDASDFTSRSRRISF
jgi:hypothetical protein